MLSSRHKSKPATIPPPRVPTRGEQFCTSWTATQAHTACDAHGLLSAENPLERYFDAHREGPGIWKWRHYFDIYHRHLAKFVGTEAQVVEIGVYSGGSLQMWKEYFGPQCRIAGIDIEAACRVYADEQVRIFIGDQADRQFWSDFRREVPQFDIVLDDGGHQPEQQMVTLEETLPYLRPGGVYLCEDIHLTGNEFATFAHTLADQLNAARWKLNGETACAATPLQASIRSVHCYPFVVVIEMNPAPVDTLRAPKHGTQWQPFYGSQLDQATEPGAVRRLQ